MNVTLPPGQRLVDGFPRFGQHLSRPAPAVPADPVIEIRGAVTGPFDVPLATLATLPRRELNADFHCVAGWSATNLHWEGVSFETFYRSIIAPALRPEVTVTHVVFRGLDRFRSVVAIEDALADDVLIAERLNGRPLDGDHGAPARLVSPSQYGYVSTKHLCRVDVRTAQPPDNTSPIVKLLFGVHPRARVWNEERHGFLPAWSVRPLYRALQAPFFYLCSRGSSQSPTPPARRLNRGSPMRLPNAVHEAGPWRIRDIAPDFTVEDVWALPVHGGAADFQSLLEIMTSSSGLIDEASLPTRFLWGVREVLGRWFGLGRISAPVEGGGDHAAGSLPIPGTHEHSLTDRLPEDLRGTAADLPFGAVPFAALYRTDVEFAAELSNRTVHAVMHLAWVDQGAGRYQGQMAVYVKPRGTLGTAYMALIKPFRYGIVYPALLRQIERAWNARSPLPAGLLSDQAGDQLGSRPLKPTTRSSVGAAAATSTTGA